MSAHLITTRALRPVGGALAVSIALLAFTAGTARAETIRAAADSGQATSTPPGGAVEKQHIANIKWAWGTASPTPPPPPPPPPPK